MENVLVVGNGFDLAFKLPTSYSDFVNSEYWPIKGNVKMMATESNLIGFIYDFTRKNSDSLGKVKWIDLEELILEYALTKKDAARALSDDVLKVDKMFFDLLKSSFTEYIVKEVYPLFDSRLKSSLLLVNKVVRSVVDNGTFKKIYSFNYTDTSQIIEFVYGKKFSVTHLHGVVRTLEDSIILGISDDADIPFEYSFLMKSHHSSFSSHNLTDDLYKAGEIILYGLSLGSADFEYFKRFLVDTVKNYTYETKKKHIHIFTYDDESRMAIVKSITQIGGLSMQDIYSCIDFKFYEVADWPNKKVAVDAIASFVEHMRKSTPGSYVVYSSRIKNKHAW